MEITEEAAQKLIAIFSRLGSEPDDGRLNLDNIEHTLNKILIDKMILKYGIYAEKAVESTMLKWYYKNKMKKIGQILIEFKETTK